jgi:hypothetical protein
MDRYNLVSKNTVRNVQAVTRIIRTCKGCRAGNAFCAGSQALLGNPCLGSSSFLSVVREAELLVLGSQVGETVKEFYLNA